MRKTGHLPDHPEVVKIRTPIQHHRDYRSMRSSPLPMMTTNRSRIATSRKGPGVLDQDGIGGCEGYAHGLTGTLRLLIMGVSAGLISPVRLYLGALLMDRGLNPDGSLTIVTDAGTMPQSIQAAWQTFGAELAANDPQYPASQQLIYADPTDPNSGLILPSIESLHTDSPYRYTGAYFIASNGSQRLLDAMTVLAAGRPLTDAIAASGPEFQNYTGGIISTLSGPIDHANTILDYEWTGASQDFQSFVAALEQGADALVASLAHYLTLHGQNSWGETTGWGEGDQVSEVSGGTYRADKTFFDNAEDLCVIDLQAA